MTSSQQGNTADTLDGVSDLQSIRRLKPRIEESSLLSILADWDWDALKRDCKLSSDARLRIASVSSGRHQAAEILARQHADIDVRCWHIDSFQSNRTHEHFTCAEVEGEAPPSNPASLAIPPNLEVLCAADLPEDEIHLGMASLITTSEAELSRDYLQQLFHRLTLGGQLVVSVDNPDDKWVHDQLKSYEKSVKVRRRSDSTVYWIEKTAPLKKLKDFSCELAYRDCDELIKLVTRPGVFSHRQLDNGARQLLDAVDVYPEARLIDIGCGSGSVALGLAKRDPSARVHAVDANARAIDCVQRGVRLNQLTNVTTEVNPTGVYGAPESFDMALANPPYFGDFRIAEKFIVAAQRSLRVGGRLVLVTKQPSWYEQNLDRWFKDCEIFPSKRYFIASGIK